MSDHAQKVAAFRAMLSTMVPLHVIMEVFGLTYEQVQAALASPPAPAEGALTREGKGVVQAAGTPSRSVLLCLSCGALPPHEGCEALCPACAPPNGTCRCPGCSLVAPAPAEGEREVAAFLAAHDRFNTFARFTIEFASDWDEALAEDEMHHVSRLRALAAPPDSERSNKP